MDVYTESTVALIRVMKNPYPHKLWNDRTHVYVAHPASEKNQTLTGIATAAATFQIQATCMTGQDCCQEQKSAKTTDRFRRVFALTVAMRPHTIFGPFVQAGLVDCFAGQRKGSTRNHALLQVQD